MPFDVFQFESTPGLNFRSLPLVAEEMLICTTLPPTKLTIARSFFPRVPGPSQVQTEESQVVVPHLPKTCFFVMSSFTPAIEVPGLITLLPVRGRWAPAAAGSARMATVANAVKRGVRRRWATHQSDRERRSKSRHPSGVRLHRRHVRHH